MTHSHFRGLDELTHTLFFSKPAQVALGWLLSKPNVTAPIVGATKLYQLEEAAAAVQVKLTADEVTYLEAPYKPHPVLGHSS
jgi:aryl-alcohol dehydrogenase-like predicted oxidoreductase